MTEKRYNVWNINETIFLEDHEKGSYHIGQIGNVDINCLNDIADLLNAQDKQIFLLKCVIQTITAESMDKNISYKRIIEIKKYWYDKLYGDLE